MANTRFIHSYSLNSGTGTQTILSTLDPIDLSRAQALSVVASLTTTDTDSVDTCAIILQSTWDNVNWDDRLRLLNFTGDMSASSLAPEQGVGAVQQFQPLVTTEEVLEPTGSAGAAGLVAGTVRNGPFPPNFRDATGRHSAWRLKIVVTDADSDASFIGTIQVYATMSYSGE